MAARRLRITFIVAALVFVVIQIVPVGAGRTNPPDGTLTAFDSPTTADLAKRACFDCHSNHTQWPWYSSIAPISWRIQHHVAEGREKLNFTSFEPTNERVADAAGEAGESITKRKMPPSDYLLMHPEARLTAAESAALVKGLDATFAAFVEKHAAEGGSETGRPTGDRESREAEKNEPHR